MCHIWQMALMQAQDYKDKRKERLVQGMQGGSSFFPFNVKTNA
jgi:hypothetical protein